jgi:hypothetical protein
MVAKSSEASERRESARSIASILVVVGYRMGPITSFPLGEPVLPSSTMAEIASDSGAMRPTAGTSLLRSAASVMRAVLPALVRVGTCRSPREGACFGRLQILRSFNYRV